MKKRERWGASIAVVVLCLCFGSMEGCHPHIDPSEREVDEGICTEEGGAVRAAAEKAEDKAAMELPDKAEDKAAMELPDKAAGEAVEDTTGGTDGETFDIDFTIRESPVDTERYDAQTDRIYKEAFLKAITDQVPIELSTGHTAFYRMLLPEGKGPGEEAFLEAVRQSDFYYQDYDGDGLPELIIDTEGPCVLKYQPEEDQVKLCWQKEPGWHLLGAGQMYAEFSDCSGYCSNRVRYYETDEERLRWQTHVWDGETEELYEVKVDGLEHIVEDEETQSRLREGFLNAIGDAPRPMSFTTLFGGDGDPGYLPGEDICTDGGGDAGKVTERAGDRAAGEPADQDPRGTQDKTTGGIVDKTTGEDPVKGTGEADIQEVDIDLTVQESPVDTERYDTRTDRIYKEAFLKAITDQAPIRYRDRQGTVTYRELLPDGEGMGEEAFLEAVRQSDFFYQDYDGDGLPELIIDTEGPCVLKYHPEGDQVELYQQKSPGWHRLGDGQMVAEFSHHTRYCSNVFRYYESMGEKFSWQLHTWGKGAEHVCKVTVDGRVYTVEDEVVRERLQEDLLSVIDSVPHPMSFTALFGEEGDQGYFPGGEVPPRYLLEDMEALTMGRESGEEWEAYKTMLEGDFSIVEDIDWLSLQRNYEWELQEYGGRCRWSYLLMDLDQDGVQELVIDAFSALDRYEKTACFRYEDGHVKMWGDYGIEDPRTQKVLLANGKILSTYDHHGRSRWIERLGPQCQEISEWGYVIGMITEGPYDQGQGSPGDGTGGTVYHHFHDYYHDGEACGAPIDLSPEEWEQVEEMIEEMIEELAIPAEAWRPCSVFTPREDRPRVPVEEIAG